MSESTDWFAGITPAEYHSYLVRIWRPTPQTRWRIMVEAVATGERRSFASLEELVALFASHLHSPPSTRADAANQERKE